MAEFRRSHSKIDSMPIELKEAIHDAIVNERLTYKQITDMILEGGYDISQKSVERYGKKFLSKLDGITRAKEQAKTIIETTAGLKLDMAEASSTVAFQLLMDMLVNTDSSNVDKNTLNAIKALASLERSAVSREKLKLQFDKGVSEAALRIKAELNKALEKQPGLFDEICNIADKIEAQLKQEYKV